MAQNSANQDYTNNADGFTLKGGTTKRAIVVTGADVTLTGSGTNVMTMPSATDTLIGRASTDTITGVKSFNDAKLVLNGVTSGTTTLKSGAAAGSSVITLPIATDTLVGLATADTLTNKTLTTPTINNPTFTGFGGITANIASTSAINTTETIVVTGTIPTAKAGTTYRCVLYGTCTSSAANISTWTLRAGTAGTTADAAVATVTLTAATTGTNNQFKTEFFFTLQTNGASGAGVGFLELVNNGTTGISGAQAGVITLAPTSTFNTTTATKFSISYKTAAVTTTSTFTMGTIEIVKP